MELTDVVKEKKFIIIVGSPRSGTTWLQNILASHPQIASLDAELKLFSSYLKPLYDAWENESYRIDNGFWRQGHPLIWSQEEFDTLIKHIVNNTYIKLLQNNPNATHILDKHPGYSYAIDVIKKALPNAKFIHIIRDGRDVVPSMISAKQRLGYGNEDVTGAIYKWKECVEYCRTGKNKYPNDFLEIKYENLRRDGSALLPLIFDFCQLSYNDKLIKNIVLQNDYGKKIVSRPDVKMEQLRAEGKIVWEEKLSLNEKYVIEEIAGKLLRELQYIDSDNWWASSDKDKRSVKINTLKKRVKLKLKHWVDKI